MADYYIELEQNSSGAWPSGRRRPWRDPACVTCTKCGAQNLKWRTDSAGRWQLYGPERAENNQLNEHVCPHDQPSPDGFEDA